LKDYNNMTGKSKETVYQYLFTCEVRDMKQVEDDVKDEFRRLREEKNREIYFYNKDLFEDYVKFIKSHKTFIKEIFIKTDVQKEVVKIVKRTTPTLKERGREKIDVLHNARRVKFDEFYTQYEDVEKELNMYDAEIWKDKTVFCNCDDAIGDSEDKNSVNTSAFSLYFIKNFEKLGLKKLICTHFAGTVDLFHQGPKGYVYTYIYTKTRTEEFKDSPKGYTGSFDDPISLKILNEEADIVCTNPPFSRMIDFWDVIIKSGKKFLIISNITNILNTAYIPYFKENKVWAGYNRVDWYLNPKRELVDAAGHWYTNIPIKDRPKYRLLKIKPLKEIPEEHKKYDDSKTLVVNEGYIPSDYKKPFAVSARPILNGLLEKGYKIIKDKHYEPYENGKVCFARVLVQKI
ncbi:MAG: adenine-specific methyltransferase EcoRI family protein, partial [Chitinivibrionia bacterium]|nr:adenine-specific methyltransferase EcoRI family protein [Chitinivibrionia bacterium]